jgi:hypothetical protein
MNYFLDENFNANELYCAFINEVYHVYGWPYWNLMKNGTMFVHQMKHMDEMKIHLDGNSNMHDIEL